MPDTTLSPRLRHLLIQEDRQTGRLIMPEGASGQTITPSVSLSSSLPSTSDTIHTPSPPTGSLMLSPPVSPSTFAFAPSPKGRLPSLSCEGVAPRGASSSGGRPTSSIFSLLNDLQVSGGGSPPSSSSSSQGSIHRTEHRQYRATPPYPPSSAGGGVGGAREPPHTAPITSHSHSMYFDERPPRPSHQHHIYPVSPGSGSSSAASDRPGLLRRHSSHPYEYSPSSSRPTTAYATGPIYEPDAYAGAMGGRAPISRTTKACNACRSRKVRCDAGGNGELGTCSRCRESGVQCVYTGIQKKRGPCPGTARPSISKPRRPSTQISIVPPPSSQRSSIASVQSYVVTPTEEHGHGWNSRSSYGFPPPNPHAPHPTTVASNGAGAIDPSEWSSVAPTKGGGTSTFSRPVTAIPTMGGGRRQSEQSVLSWPAMEPAQEVVSPMGMGMGMFDRDYAISVRGRNSMIEHQHQRALPPLRVAIHRGSYHEAQ
ncbi:hypothetical protein CI109_105145 [Kwoniella shandongensis]|uniref:Uncharacterized protein n=1 Tax=Kwoniella shandongensis TaxID=1734106 RepID=A0A5M6C8N4_9TREE|nr:uncharacterized protein CI109_001984 [Kwoniella shandongensis]KAA5529559.1 hypothetical protein CI109_001984 [Kwoniella shandongensis]